MPKSKKRGGSKAHAKRVRVRNQKTQSEKNRIQRIQREMLEQIMMEAQKGAFESSKPVEGEESSESTPEDNIGNIELEL